MRKPLITVVIPNLNNSARLTLTLAALASQSQVTPSEIFVIDNGSEDDSVEVARASGAVVISHPETKNPYICRNIGLRRATGDHILLLDSSCVPTNFLFLNELYSFSESVSEGVIVGKILFEFSDKSTLGEIADSILFIGNDEGGEDRRDYPAGVMFFKKDILKKVGFFREDLRSGADDEWTRRVIDHGFSITFSERAMVSYPAKRFGPLMTKALRTGKGHHALLKETHNYKPIHELLRMRPPSPAYLDDIIERRGYPEFKNRKLELTFVIWAYRIILGWGRLFG